MTQFPKFNAKLLHPRYWATWTGIGILWLLVQLPYPIIYRFGCGLGRVAQHIMKRRAHIVYRNLELCFPKMNDSDRHFMAIKNFESVGMGVMESGIAWFWSDKRLSRWYEVTGTGIGPINQIQTNKTGILLIGVHFLTLEIGARMFGLEIPGIGVYRPNDNPVIDWMQTWGRMRSNKGMIDRKNLKGMIRALKRGEVLWYAPDHDYGRPASVFVPLFAVKDAATTIGTWMLARMSKSVIVPFVPRRKSNGKGYELMILKPEFSPPLEDATITARWMNNIIERCILLAPEQYMWLHRRFKTHPVGMRSRY